MTSKGPSNHPGSRTGNRTSNRTSQTHSQLYIVLAIILLGVFIAVMLVVNRPTAERKEIINKPPEVEVLVAQAKVVRIPVYSQGNVEAKTRINLAAEISGRIVEMSSLMDAGGFFKKNDLLLRIDDSDYRLAITKAEALVAAARQVLARTEAEASQARFDLKRIGRSEKTSSDYALRVPHLKEARANLKAAQADLEIAKLQLQRSRITAPFDGRVVKKQVDIGQYVVPGAPLVEMYSTESVVVHLPLSQSQISLVNLPIGQTVKEYGEQAAAVLLSAQFAGKQWTWQGKVVRTEGLIDTRNRLLYAIVEVDSPYDKVEQPQRPPLTAGMFVRATIEGRDIEQVYVLPRKALHYGHQLWLMDSEDRLLKRAVNVLHKDERFVYIDQGLSDGDRVILSALDYAVDGMLLSASNSNEVQLGKLAQ